MLKNIKNSQLNCVKKRTLVIRMIKSHHSRTYFFEEKIIIAENIAIFFKKKSK